ncbi:cobaltochelatase subunit CobN [Clostridium algidicarnis]|uniref:cobaltochelatase subunit CobN n=1 Tax=Clostridium algidicarnis TaxID=37659 RepID=UPI001623D0C1|nr:cobaltochelatase subunit CobN [Clostridium algidicarnis]MBB6696692.1 cobaltochelatase subunit CobN [Clostridium algidicarnis]
MKITFVTVSTTAIKHLIDSGRYIKERYGNILNLKLYYAVKEMDCKKIENMNEAIENSDLVFIDLMGANANVIKSVYKALDNCKGNIIPYGNSVREYLKLGNFTAETMKPKEEIKDMGMSEMKTIQFKAEGTGIPNSKKVKDMKNYSAVMKYFNIANKENITNMLLLLLREYGNIANLSKPMDPKEFRGVSICNPKCREFYDTFNDYEMHFPFNEGKPNIVFLFYGQTYPTDTFKCVATIKNKVEEFANVIPIAVSGPFSENKDKFEEIILKQKKYSIDLIVNFMSFRIGAGPMGGDADAGVKFLKNANVPYFHPFFMTKKTSKEWKESIQGCSSSETMISVMLPELDGCIETNPIGAMCEPKYDEEFDVLIEELEVIEERADRLASRIKRQINLKNKKNQEKKVAIICYNYPPGESNLFGGAFLDTFSSVENILKSLKCVGYKVDDLKKEDLMNIFTAGRAVNSGRYNDEWKDIIKYSDKDYIEELKNTFDYNEMIEQWGESPGEIMANENHEFLIPGAILKNVFIGLQPSRGIHEDSEKTYHDKTLLPHHQYQGFYRWVREEFKADAIIHVGTHGTLEFLKGKECGISGECYADKLLGDIPHMYLYYCGNPSEAVMAKRRSNANIISYQPPVFVPGELYGDYSKLMSLVDNYHQSLLISPESSKNILSDVFSMAEQLNMPSELEKIESELYRMNSSLISKGLHAFGDVFSEEESKDYVRSLLNYSRNGILSIRVLVAKTNGYDVEKLLEEHNFQILRELDRLADEVFIYYMDNNDIDFFDWIDKDIKKEFISTLEYGKKVYKEVQENFEIEGLLKTLSAQYNQSKLAGDIYRHPEIMPTGYNLHQFDSRLIPTSTAYMRGLKVSENTINAYREENDQFPLSIAVILWGLETSRTQGETFSQILSYLGVRISDKSSTWETKYEIIPIEKLGRPRIDVTINICGFFRDMFPNLIENLSDVFELIYELEESDEENYFKANSKKLYKKLVEEGHGEKEAKELAISRIFGPEEGQYGTGITDVVETKRWEEEEQLGGVFINKLQHVYNRNMRGKKVQGLYEKNLMAVELVSQIRSNHEYQVTDLDHYYEFFGGLAKSVEMVKGKQAKLYITDTTEEKIFTETLEKSISRGIRTRVLNPKWIDGMLKHKYHGVQKISERFENVLGFAATTNSVDEWIYNDMHSCYVEDEALSKRMKENNPYAYMDILESMMEYYNRGYWNATEEQLEKIKEIYLELEDGIEERL